MADFDGSRVASVRTALVDIPLARPVGTSFHQIESVACVLVTVATDDRTTGTGFCFTIDRDELAVLRDAVDALAGRVAGRSVTTWGAESEEVWSTARPTTPVAVAAFAAVDTAVWDAAARHVHVPLPRLWGQVRDRVDCYASTGFWLSDSSDTIVSEAHRYVAMGFRAVKVRVGHSLAEDLDRVAAVVDAVGPDVAVYTDANQSFDVATAIERGRALAAIGVSWFEEPVRSADAAGHAAVRAEVPLEVATGESELAADGLQPYLDRDAVDVLMPDLQRVGGYGQFRRAAGAARAHDVALSSHFFTEYTLAVAASQPHFRTIEAIDWFAPLFAETPELVDGQLVIPDRPGHGFTFAPDVVDRFGV